MLELCIGWDKFKSRSTIIKNCCVETLAILLDLDAKRAGRPRLANQVTGEIPFCPAVQLPVAKAAIEWRRRASISTCIEMSRDIMVPESTDSLSFFARLAELTDDNFILCYCYAGGTLFIFFLGFSRFFKTDFKWKNEKGSGKVCCYLQRVNVIDLIVV